MSLAPVRIRPFPAATPRGPRARVRAAIIALSVAVVAVLGVASPAAAAPDVGAGRQFAVWLKADGTVWTWGYGPSGELGNGSTGISGHSYAPVQVETASGVPLTGVTKLSVGSNHAVVQRSDGSLWGWGAGSCGRLARGSTANQPYAAQLMFGVGNPVAGIADFEAADNSTLLALGDGRLLVAGSTPGDGSATCSAGSYPEQATYANGSPVATAIAVGGGSMYIVVLADGSAWSWGPATYGKTAHGDDVARYYPTPMLTAPGVPVTGVVDATAGGFQSFVLKADGTAMGAGYNAMRELGNFAAGAESSYLVPVESSAGVTMTSVVEIQASRQQHVLFRRTDNSIWATGQYNEGEKGNGGACCSAMAQIQTGYASMDAGWVFSVWLRADGVALGSGWNAYGEAGGCNNNVQFTLVVITATCPATSVPLRPTGLSQLNADGTAMRIDSNTSRYWTQSGITDNVNFSWTSADPNPSQTLTPRFQHAPMTAVFSVNEACSTIGSPLAPLTTTTAYTGVSTTSSVTGLAHGSMYHWRVCSIDQGGLGSHWANRNNPWSYEDANYGVDAAAPTAPTSVMDGYPGDDDWTISTTNLVATHTGATDDLSGVWGVSSCVSTSPTGADCSSGAVRTWEPKSTYYGTTPGRWTVSGLSLSQGVMYYICAKAEDFAKNASTGVTCADGIQVDTTAPALPVVSDGAAADVDWISSTSLWEGNWTAGAESGSGLADHDWCISLSATGSDCALGATRTWTATSATSFTASTLALTANQRYFTCVRSRDQLGNTSTTGCSDGAWVNLNAPTIAPTIPVGGASAQPWAPSLQATYGDADGTAGVVDFQVCSEAACTGVVRTGSVSAVAAGGTAAWTVSPQLAAGTTYWWRAMATDAGTRATSWSTSRSFTTVAAPTITSISPASAAQGRSGLPVTITGNGFQAAAVVAISGSGVAFTVGSVTATQITGTVDVAAGASLGARDLTVTNVDASTVTATGAFTVTAPAITLGFSTLGYTHAARDEGGISFAPIASGDSLAIGPPTSGQTTPGPAVRLSITTDTDVDVLTRSTDWAGPATLTTGTSYSWKPSVGSSWTGFTATDAAVATVLPGTTVHDFDLQISIPDLQRAGDYSTTTTWTVTPSP